MAEIKSTIELALEKTKGMTISSEERQEIKRKEILQKVDNLFRRFIEGRISTVELLRELQRAEPANADEMKKQLVSRFVETISIDDENNKKLEAIEALTGKSMDGPRQVIHEVASRFHAEQEEVQRSIRSILEEELRRDGISGSSVVVDARRSPAWKEWYERKRGEYQERIEQIRQLLRQS